MAIGLLGTLPCMISYSLLSYIGEQEEQDNYIKLQFQYVLHHLLCSTAPNQTDQNTAQREMVIVLISLLKKQKRLVLWEGKIII